MRAIIIAGLAIVSLATACSREPGDGPAAGKAAVSGRSPVVTISADQAVSPVPAWVAPAVEVSDANAEQLKARAAAAVKAGRLFAGAGVNGDATSIVRPGAEAGPEAEAEAGAGVGADGDGDGAAGGDAAADLAIPIYLALRRHAPDDAAVRAGFAAALQALLAQGDAALDAIDDDPLSLRSAHEVGAVVRVVAPDQDDAVAYLDRLERVDQAQQANRLGEAELNAGRLGEAGTGGAIALFRQALQLRPGDDIHATVKATDIEVNPA